MRNIAVNVATAFILSTLVGYWIPVIVSMKIPTLKSDMAIVLPLMTFTSSSPILDSKTMSSGGLPVLSKESTMRLWSRYPVCDPFTDKNRCILSSPLQTILKTPSQQNQYIYVLQKLEEYQLPHKLALLPIIESQYNPFAISPKGAAGVWQLMPNTAKSYGIQDHERFQLEPSTTAALLFLKELYKQFGSWELAIAAYNAGSKRVQQAVDQNPTAKSVQELSLPDETKKYVSSFNELQVFMH